MSLLADLGKFIHTRFTREAANDQWPFVPGKYLLVNPSAPVVVAMAGSERAATDLAGLAPSGLCLVTVLRSSGTIEKLLRNLSSNLSIQYLILAGEDAERRPLGAALLRLTRGNGEELEEKAAAAFKAVTAKLDEELLATVRKQIKAVDLLGCEDLDKILARISQLASEAKRPTTGFVAPENHADEGVERVIAARNVSYDTQPDKAGAFGIRVEGKAIVVEHRSQKEELLRIIEGVSARDIYLTLIRNGWVSKLEHAAYLGRELTRAELALNQGKPFHQGDDRPIGTD